MLLGHVALAAGAWWLLPHGFPLAHPRTLANTVAPALILAVALGGASARARRPRVTAIATSALAAAWLGGVGGLLAAFPTSGPRALPLVLAGVLATTTAAVVTLWAAPPLGRRGGRRLGVAALLGAALGLGLPFTQRGPAPDTRPLLRVLPQAAFDGWPARAGQGATPSVQVDRARGHLDVEVAGVRLFVAPLLTFDSRSPDAGWTVFATHAQRVGPRRTPAGGDALEARFTSDEGPAALRVRPRPGAVDVEGVVTLAAPMFGHLCSYAEVLADGLRSPRLIFSPCPDVPIDVRESDYPVGRPARLAYWDGARLTVVEASSGEKGPFTTLAAGPLDRGEPLAMTLLDGDEPVVRLTWLDWSAQAGLQPSPTAGWGLPVNAIELQRSGRLVHLYLTLAATSVGRGWDSVGHADGVYRDRLVIEPLR